MKCPACGSELQRHCSNGGCDCYRCNSCRIWGTLELVKGVYRFARYTQYLTKT